MPPNNYKQRQTNTYNAIRTHTNHSATLRHPWRLDSNQFTTYKKELIMRSLDNFKWTRQKNGVLDTLEIYNEKSLFGKGHANLCMMHENKHVLATNLRVHFFALTLHKSLKLAERILIKEKLA